MDRKKEKIYLQIQDIEEFYNYLYERENAAATIAKYRNDLQIFYRFLGEDKCVDKIRLIAYKEWLITHYAVSSANSMLAALNQFLIFMGTGTLRLKRIRIQKQFFSKKEKEMQKEEYRRLIQTAKAQNKYKLALLMETICATGIRISELSYFTVEGVKKGRIQVHNKGKIRTILLPQALRKKLLYFAGTEKIEKGMIFITRTGKPKNRSNIWAEMKQLHKEAGVAPEKIFPHNLRHLFARVYYQTTGDITGLADILGHGSLETTRIYMASACEYYQERLDKMKLII